MKYNPQIHHRRSIRLKGYDYSQAGAYFVTIATQGMACLFGEIRDGEMHLSPPGQMVERWWVELVRKFPTVGLGEYAIMPNHFHGIIIIHPQPVGVDLCVDPGARVEPGARVDPGADQGAHTGAPVQHDAEIVGVDLCIDPGARIEPGAHVDPGSRIDPGAGQGAHTGAPVRDRGVSLSTIVQWFKTMTTNEYIRAVRQLGWEPFAGKLWQRNYYEHIIRDESDLLRIEDYIQHNPSRWEQDQLHPQALPKNFFSH